MEDLGKLPLVINIEKETEENENFRTTRWTGKYLQMVYMTLETDEKISLEKHDTVDQFIRIEEGSAIVKMGKSKDNLDFVETAEDDFAIFIPAGYWHEITATDKLKLYTIYSPPEHSKNTIKESKLFKSFYDSI